jgi:hypothetical protein
MDHEPDARLQALARGVLMLYKQAVRMGEQGVAEHLLAALEELARCDRACSAMRDDAYLLIGQGLNV